MGSGKSGSQSKDYYGNMAWELGVGPLDFTWGLQLDNDLVWPKVKLWDSKIWKKGTYLIFTDGNVYRASEKTNTDPNAFPWVQVATPWVAGTYHAGDKKLYLGNVWECESTTNIAPPAAPTTTQVEAQSDIVTNGWIYVCTPEVWSGIGSIFWDAGSITAWKGRLWTTAVHTATEPGEVGSDWTLFRINRATSPNPLKFTVEDSGDWFLYWGTPDQVLDGVDETVLSSEGHPPYRNKIILVAKNVKFGTMKTTPPNPVLLGGRAPIQTLIIDNTAVAGVNATALDADWQANPWVVLAELLTNKIYGLGLPDTYFDAASWQAEADRCAANPQLFYISPVITSLTKVREIVATLLSYPDAFIFWSTVATLTAGHWPHGEAAPAFDATNTINRNKIVKGQELNWQSGNWAETANSVEVSFRDWEAGFKSRTVAANSLFNMAVVGRMQSKKIDRPHIIRQSQALSWATEFAKIASEPSVKGEVTIQAEKASGVTPGKVFLLTDDVLGVSKVQRCTKQVISGPPAGTRKLTHETERGASPQPYSPTAANPTAAQGPSPSPILSAQVVQLPTSLAGVANRVACLAGRQDDVTTALSLWFQQADGAAYQDLGRQSAFAIGAACLQNVNNGYAGYILTQNLAATPTTFAIPAGTISLNVTVTYIPTGGALTGGLAYGADYTVDLINGTITIPNGSAIPLGSEVIATIYDGTIVTANATPGNTYDVPRGFWTWNVWKRAAGAAYTGAFSGSTHCTEGTDYLIDAATGKVTIINGGAINATDVVFLFCAKSIVLKLSPTAPQQDVDHISSPPTVDEVNDNSILVFLIQKADPSKFEIMSLQSFEAAAPIYLNQGTRNYNCRVVRGAFGTQLGGDGAHVWTLDDIAFIIKKSDIASFGHESFASLANAAATANFIIAPESAWVIADTADIYDPANNPAGLSTNLSYEFANLYSPKVSMLQLMRNGVQFYDWSSLSFETTDVVTALYNIESLNGELAHITITGTRGDEETTLYSSNLQPLQSQNVWVRFQFPRAGSWRLRINALDLDGNSSAAIDPDSGKTIFVGTGTSIGPCVESYEVIGSQVINLKFGIFYSNVHTLYWQIKNRGTAPDAQGAGGGVWNSINVWNGLATGYDSAAIANFATGKTLYVYTTTPAKANSDTIQFNIDR